MSNAMTEPVKIRRKFGRLEYDPVTGTYIVAALVFAAVVLGTLAFNDRGSPRTDDKAIAQRGATIPDPAVLSPAAATGAGTHR